MSRRKLIEEHYRRLHQLCELLASSPSLWEEVPEGKREELKGFCNIYFSHRPPTIALSEMPQGNIHSLIYRVVYEELPEPDPEVVRWEKIVIGNLVLFPHLASQLDVPIIYLPQLGVYSCPALEWELGHFILPTLLKWAPSQPFQGREGLFEWDVWREFLCRRLADETKLSIPPFGQEKEITKKRETEDEVLTVRGDEVEKQKKKNVWAVWREKVYEEGWDDILRECMLLALEDDTPPEEVVKIAEKKWKEGT